MARSHVRPPRPGDRAPTPPFVRTRSNLHELVDHRSHERPGPDSGRGTQSIARDAHSVYIFDASSSAAVAARGGTSRVQEVEDWAVDGSSRMRRPAVGAPRRRSPSWCTHGLIGLDCVAVAQGELPGSAGGASARTSRQGRWRAWATRRHGYDVVTTGSAPRLSARLWRRRTQSRQEAG